MNSPDNSQDGDSEYDRLVADGSLKKISDYIKNSTDVHIQRTGGEWQMAKVLGVSANMGVVVEFQDIKSGQTKSKSVPISELLEWQERLIN